MREKETVGGLRREEQRLRARRIRLLKARLERARAEVRNLEKELRLAGVTAEQMGGDWTNWTRVLDEMPDTFTVAQLQAATGAKQNLMSAVLDRWLKSGRVLRMERGTYRKQPWRTLHT
jgi:hypothetical protein